MKSFPAGCILRFAVAAFLGLIAVRAVADAPESRAPLELTDENLASVIDPLMTQWTDGRKGAVVVVVKRDGPVFAKGYGFADIEARKPSPPIRP